MPVRDGEDEQATRSSVANVTQLVTLAGTSAHAVAAEFAARRDDELLTHGYVVAESLAVARRRFGLEGTVTLLDDVLPPITLLPVDLQLHAAAQQAYRASLPGATSFVHLVSLALIKREGIGAALALDPDLSLPGVTLFPQTPGS